MARTAPKKAVKKKAAPKKKAVVKSKVLTSAALLAELEKMGYEIDEDSEQDEDFSDGDVTRRSFDVMDRDGDSIAKINISDGGLRHCCGVIELGGLDISESWAFEETKEHNRVVNMATAYVFLYLREKYITPTTKRNLSAPYMRPVIFTSNGEEDCVIFEAAATKYLKNAYKVVSTTVNPGSDRTIKIYMSFS